MHDPRVGRFFARDPLTYEYPWYSPYQFSGNRVIDMVELEGLEPKKKGFWEGFGESIVKGVIKVVKYVANNPNHSGYGYNPNMKPPTKEDFARYEINWSEQLDPHWQIKNFSITTVYGVSNFIGGIKNKDGAQTAQSLPLLMNSIGTISILRNIPSGVAKLPTNKIHGTATISNAIEVSSLSKSLRKFLSFDKEKVVDFVFDPKTKRLLMSQSNDPNAGGHTRLYNALNISQDEALGGRIKIKPDGTISTSEWSGHTGQNWNIIENSRNIFKEFIDNTFGKETKHIHSEGAVQPK